MTENSPHQGTIPFWLNIVPLGLVSAFLYVGSPQISCGDIPTRFFFIFSMKLLHCQNS